LHDDKYLSISDNGTEYRIVQKKHDLNRPTVRAFTQTTLESEVLEFFDVANDDIYLIDQPNLRRDNFSEIDKVIPKFGSALEAKKVLENLDVSKVMDELNGFEFIRSQKLMNAYPASFIHQVYNFHAGMKDSKDEYVSSFFELETISFGDIFEFIEFFANNKNSRIYEATLVSRVSVCAAFVELNSESGGTADDLEFALDLSTPAFTGYVGYDELVNSSKAMVNRFFNGAKLAKYSKKPQKDKLSLMLYGPPGTGKTQFMIELYKHALQLAQSNQEGKNSPKFKLFKLAKTDFGSSYHNASERNLQEYLDTIEEYLDADVNHFALFFIDEVDEIAAQRVEAKGACDKSDNSVITILLKCLSDKRKLRRTIFVCATNFYDNLDAAFKRPGRFDQAYHMGYLNNPVSIEELLNVNLAINEINLDAKPPQFKELIRSLAQVMKQTKTTTPAEIASMVVQIKTRLDSRVEKMEDVILQVLTSIEQQHDLDYAQQHYLTMVYDLLTIEDIMEAFYATYPKLAQVAKESREAHSNLEQTDYSDSHEAGYILRPLDDTEYPIYEFEANDEMKTKLTLGSEYVTPGKVDIQLLNQIVA
jgi:DNA polymerase III delta prime subunit